MRHKKNKITEVLKTFYSRILELPFGRRLSFFAALFALMLLFFPAWVYQSGTGLSAFDKTFVFGFIILLLNIFSVLIILREIFSHVGTLGNFRHSDILLFAFSQSLFTVVLANAALQSFVAETTDYEMSDVGMMLIFVTLGVGLAGVFFSRDFVPTSGEKKEVFVDKNIDLSESNMDPESKLSLGDYEEFEKNKEY